MIVSMIGADPEVCNPQTLRQARYFAANSYYLEQGQSKYEVLQMLGSPEKNQKRYARANGAPVEVFLYRTGHKACRNMPTEENYTPVVLYNGTYWGHGKQFAYNALR